MKFEQVLQDFSKNFSQPYEYVLFEKGFDNFKIFEHPLPV